MVLARNIRKEKLTQLRNNPASEISRSKLYYKGVSTFHSVHQIDMDFLIYNRHNGRLESEMLTWQKVHAVGDDEYNSELHELIADFLWKDNTSRNKRTLEDLKIKGQQRPGIVTRDGVIIDGNRRAMLLRRLESEMNAKKYFEAIILPDAYDENEKEIVRLETQYQMGEDAILPYGPLEKYLHAKRLKETLGVDVLEIAQLMGESESEVKKLLGIMELMDDYLDHIGCPGLYTMLKEESGGTKEGMFVDLYSDLNRFKGSSPSVQWAFDPAVDLLDLQTIQFDFIRFGSELTGTNKNYRAISHEGSGKNSFFAHKKIWDKFSSKHRTEVDPITDEMGTLEEYVNGHPDCPKLDDAAIARDNEWRHRVRSSVKENFGLSVEELEVKVDELEPPRLLARCLSALSRIDKDNKALFENPECRNMIMQINRLTFEMKKQIERYERASSGV